MISSYYIAGLIDGEGYLGLLPCRTKGLINQSFEPVVKIGMTGDEVIPVFTQLVDTYGGLIERRARRTKGNRKAYVYVLKGRTRVHKMLEDITPSLYVKRSQSVLLLEFCALPMTHSRHKAFNQKALNRKIAIYAELKQLKQPPATTE